jgi:uncharacterized phage protein (TIGR01671 family)
MTRQIKFRFWSKILNTFVIPDNCVFIGALKDDQMAVMQYTGLQDKNGKEIYEGDIVQFDFPDEIKPRGVIVYDDHYEGGGRFYPTTEVYLAIDWWQEKERWYRLEVIGNIHENPELLEQEVHE